MLYTKFRVPEGFKLAKNVYGASVDIVIERKSGDTVQNVAFLILGEECLLRRSIRGVILRQGAPDSDYATLDCIPELEGIRARTDRLYAGAQQFVGIPINAATEAQMQSMVHQYAYTTVIRPVNHIVINVNGI